MKHSAMLKFTVMMFAVFALYLGGCVEVNNPDVKSVDLRSSVKFVDFANTGSSMVVSIDKSTTSTATVTFQNASSYFSLPSGARFFSFAYGGNTDTLRQPLTANYKYTFFSVYESTNGDTARTYVLSAERNMYSGTAAFVAGSQLVRFYNMSSDTTPTVSGGLTFHLVYAPTDSTVADTSNASPLVFPGGTVYYPGPTAKSPKFLIIGAKNDTLVQPTAVGAGDGRFGVVFTGSKAASSWTAKVFKED